MSQTKLPLLHRGFKSSASKTDKVPQSAPEQDQQIFGAIDLGTNNCRLLVSVSDPRVEGGFRIIDSFSRIVRLGEGLSNTGALLDVAIDRAVDALAICAEVMARNKAVHYRAIATEACRRAANGAAFIDRVRQDTGLNLEIISAAEEADLTFAGCASLLEPNQPFGIVLDIGGGSSELMWVERDDHGLATLKHYHSVPEGVVTLADQFGHGMDAPGAYENLIARIMPWFDDFSAGTRADEALISNELAMLGTSGTVTTLGALHLGLRRYSRNRVDGMVIDFDSIAALSRKLAMMTVDSRASHPCIGEERADLVVMGCAILEAVCRRWPVGRMRVADRGIREGILSQLHVVNSRGADQVYSSLK